jgi:hypothetical protein
MSAKYNLLKSAIEVYNLKPIGHTFKDKEIKDFFTLENWKCRLHRNVGK